MRVRSVFVVAVFAAFAASAGCGPHHDTATPAASPTPVQPAVLTPSPLPSGVTAAASPAPVASETPAPEGCPKSALTFSADAAKPVTTEMPETHAGLIGPGMPPKDAPATKPIYYVTLKNAESGRSLSFQVMSQPVAGSKLEVSHVVYEEPTFHLDSTKGAAAKGSATFSTRSAPGQPVCGTFDLTISDAKHKVTANGNFLAKERPPPPMMPMKGE